MVVMAVEFQYESADRRRRIQLEVAGGAVCVGSHHAAEDAEAGFCAREQAVNGAAESRERTRALSQAVEKKPQKKKAQVAFPDQQLEGDTLWAGLSEAANSLVGWQD